MPDLKQPPRKGYRYSLSDEAILRYMQWPIAVRLTWLEEANRFLFQALSEENKKIRDGFRKGTV